MKKELTMEEKINVVTDEEPYIVYKEWKAMPFIIGNEAFEKLGTIGTSSNLLVYFTSVFHMKSITATNLVNIFNGTSNFATLPGAFLSDTYFGRYKTLGFTSVACFLGMFALTMTAAIPSLHPTKCDANEAGSCRGPTSGQTTFLLSSLALLVIGAGGIRPCNFAFGADQFNPKTESGKSGIISFFNWYYFSATLAVMLSVTVIVYVQSDVSWTWGLAVPAFIMSVSALLFFMGSRNYVKVKPEGSPLSGVVQTLVAAFNKRNLELPDQPCINLFNHVAKNSINSIIPYSDQFRFLNKAAIITCEDKNVDTEKSAAINPWRLSSVQQVEEVKCLIRMIPIWLSSVIYYIATIQPQTYGVLQALQSDRLVFNTNFKIPAASYTIFSMLGIITWIPIYDKILVPRLQRFTKIEGGITLLQKVGIGMFLAFLSMLVSALVEEKRRNFENPIGVEPGKGEISSLSGMWLVPQLVLIGLSEAFTLLGLMEFYYKEFPENMRSVAGSFSFVGNATSSYLSSFLISIVHQFTKNGGDWLPQDLNKGKLDNFYYLVAALELMNLGFFLMCAKWYKYKARNLQIVESSKIISA
jgi:peptide/histidine transporter 3/4